MAHTERIVTIIGQGLPPYAFPLPSFVSRLTSSVFRSLSLSQEVVGRAERTVLVDACYAPYLTSAHTPICLPSYNLAGRKYLRCCGSLAYGR